MRECETAKMALLIALSFAILARPIHLHAQLRPEAEASRGIFLDDDDRYDQEVLPLRILKDLVAIPANAVYWGWEDWATFGGVMAVGGALMLPVGEEDKPFDVWFNDWFGQYTDPHVPEIWTRNNQIVLFTSVAVGGVSTWAGAALLDYPRVAQGVSLMVESVAVTQAYHLTLKLLTGRDGSGVFQGPPESFEIFPGGTPSGHWATFYSLWGSAEAYWQPHWAIRIAGHTLVAAGAVSHMLNHRHEISEVWFGATMGYAIGRWVVRHRASDEVGEEGVDLQVIPRPDGVALRWIY